jgi:formamidopyrimidine-DNA glycosylase
MPEGPEVTYLAQVLRDNMVGKKLVSIDILRGRYKVHEKPERFDEFMSLLPLKCKYVEKKGKVLFLYFEKDWCIVSKLGMTGWWYDHLHKPSWRNMYPNIVFSLMGGRKRSEVHYSDFRNFGTLSFYKSSQDIQQELDKTAPDILSPSTTFRKTWTRIEGLRASKKEWLIEDALIDQKVIISGIGNYLKSESLYASRISPLRKVRDISRSEWLRLFYYMKKITSKMLIALKSNDANKYMDSMHVYRRTVDPLGNTIATRISKAGRMTYWVPTLQK